LAPLFILLSCPYSILGTPTFLQKHFIVTQISFHCSELVKYSKVQEISKTKVHQHRKGTFYSLAMEYFRCNERSSARFFPQYTHIGFLLLLLGITSSAFVVQPSSRRNAVFQFSLFVDGNGHNGEFNADEPTSKTIITNEWGIPDSKTLPPLASSPLAQLPNGGKITLVGSGPGDPELLTVAAYKLLQDPNALVICDRLVSPEILDLVRGEKHVARKMPGCAELAQEEIYAWAHQGLQQGKHVIRLKIGDPFVFGRGGEEVLTFRRFGVESKVIPVSCLPSLTVCENRMHRMQESGE
jgi:hypothetical protein